MILPTKVPQIPQVPILDEEIPSRDLWDLWDGRDLWDIPCPTLVKMSFKTFQSSKYFIYGYQLTFPVSDKELL